MVLHLHVCLSSFHQLQPRARLGVSLHVRRLGRLPDSGRGRNGSWSRKGEISDSQRMFVLFAILDEGALSKVLEEVYALVSAQIGIVSVSDVEVIRAEHF